MCEKNKKPQETIELTDDQLEQVAGGAEDAALAVKKCDGCDKAVNHIYRDGHWYCTVCGKRYEPLPPLIVYVIT